jgi:hypothetical protein
MSLWQVLFGYHMREAVHNGKPEGMHCMFLILLLFAQQVSKLLWCCVNLYTVSISIRCARVLCACSVQYSYVPLLT